jgi:hypothetical protein
LQRLLLNYGLNPFLGGVLDECVSEHSKSSRGHFILKNDPRSLFGFCLPNRVAYYCVLTGFGGFLNFFWPVLQPHIFTKHETLSTKNGGLRGTPLAQYHACPTHARARDHHVTNHAFGVLHAIWRTIFGLAT